MLLDINLNLQEDLLIYYFKSGIRGIYHWEIDELDLDLIEGQAEYDFFRSSGDGTSALLTPNGVYGISDVLEAQLRLKQNSNNTIRQSYDKSR